MKLKQRKIIEIDKATLCPPIFCTGQACPSASKAKNLSS